MSIDDLVLATKAERSLLGKSQERYPEKAYRYRERFD